MKSKKKLNLFSRTVIFLSAAIVFIVITAITLFYYLFSISEPEGLSLAKWPQDFTNSFSVWTTYENGNLTVEEIGLERLDEYGLWIQFIDESGEEIFSHNKPVGYPTKYSASELIELRTSDFENGNTVFTNTLDDSGEKCSYMVGFPYDIGRYILHYNGERVARLSPVARFIVLITVATLSVAVLCYCFWLFRKLSKVTKGISDVALRNYIPLKENGVFSEIYRALNKMDRDLRNADKVKEETEQARREWITNITHDLKTPLSPVKGYAELLVDAPETDALTVQEYGGIILKNVNHAEKLINDLKLTYQLESGAVPYHPQEVRLVRFLKEVVIDIANDPAFSDRNIEFESDTSELVTTIDPDLFRRAIQNLLVNALIHNSPETKVHISVNRTSKKGTSIFIRDNGNGMSETEQSELFNRYYRGTNTKEKPEGSGLGLAIAKQIITLHGGDIIVKSKVDVGTEFVISIPAQN